MNDELVDDIGELRTDGGDSMNASSREDCVGCARVGPKRKAEVLVRRLLALCSTRLDECPLRIAGLKHVGILRLGNVSVVRPSS